MTGKRLSGHAALGTVLRCLQSWRMGRQATALQGVPQRTWGGSTTGKGTRTRNVKEKSWQHLEHGGSESLLGEVQGKASWWWNSQAQGWEQPFRHAVSEPLALWGFPGQKRCQPAATVPLFLPSLPQTFICLLLELSATSFGKGNGNGHISYQAVLWNRWKYFRASICWISMLSLKGFYIFSTW